MIETNYYPPDLNVRVQALLAEFEKALATEKNPMVHILATKSLWEDFEAQMADAVRQVAETPLSIDATVYPKGVKLSTHTFTQAEAEKLGTEMDKLDVERKKLSEEGSPNPSFEPPVGEK